MKGLGLYQLDTSALGKHGVVGWSLAMVRRSKSLRSDVRSIL